MFAILIERVEHADADGHADRGDEREYERQEQPGRGCCAGFGQHGDARAEGEAFEHLVEDDDDEEGFEDGVAGDDEGDADYCEGVMLADAVGGMGVEGSYRWNGR